MQLIKANRNEKDKRQDYRASRYRLFTPMLFRYPNRPAPDGRRDRDYSRFRNSPNRVIALALYAAQASSNLSNRPMKNFLPLWLI